jgi:hypothetical protein
MKIELPNSWMIAVNKAIITLHNRFKGDSKFILTESDLKCWLFYELQNQKTYVPFAVHSEITHYAEHYINNEIVVKKHKFRDLSLLTPSAVIDNENFLSEGGKKEEILTKGFKHKAPAIHFELKFIRQGNNLNPLESDITKLNEYYPAPETAERKFVVVWGSRCSTNNLVTLKTKFKNTINQLNRNHDLIEFYLFDNYEIVHIIWNGDIKQYNFY